MTQLNKSSRYLRAVSRWSIVAVAASVFLCGIFWRSTSLLGVGAALLCLLLRRIGVEAADESGSGSANRSRREPTRSPRSVREEADDYQALNEQLAPAAGERNAAPGSTDALVDELLADGRYALLL